MLRTIIVDDAGLDVFTLGPGELDKAGVSPLTIDLLEAPSLSTRYQPPSSNQHDW